MVDAQILRHEDRFLETGKAPPLEQEDGSGFGWYDRLFFGYNIDDPRLVFQYTDWEARDLQPFLTKDYKARQIMNVLQLPIEFADHSFEAADGDKGELEWLKNFWELDPLNGGCKTPLDDIISQMTTAFAYKRAFFEKVFKQDDDGKIVYDKVAFRPQTTCRELRDVEHATFQGFEQEPYYLSLKESKLKPIVIPKERAFVYLNGQRNDPINGMSDMEVPYWCYKTKQKIMLLLFQFLEGVSLPRQMVGAQELGVAQAIAGQMAKARNSGVIPYAVQGGSMANVKIDTIDASGKGAEQFMQTINFLDGAAVDSVLAGFLNLTGTATRALGNGGSYALSKDASDFFLQSESAITREISASVRGELFAPIVRANFGRNAAVPTYEFEPLNDEDKSNSIALLNSMIAASAQPGSTNPVPTEFVSELSRQVGDYLGLDGDKIAVAFEKAASEAKVAAAAQSAAMASPAGQDVAAMSGATNLASKVTSPHGLAVLKKLGVPA